MLAGQCNSFHEMNRYEKLTIFFTNYMKKLHDIFKKNDDSASTAGLHCIGHMI